MKKIISMFLGLVLCLSLTACGKDKEKTPAKKEFITDEQIAKLYTDCCRAHYISYNLKSFRKLNYQN